MALFWGFGSAFLDDHRSAVERIGYTGLWCAGVAATIYLIVEIVRGRHNRLKRTWYGPGSSGSAARPATPPPRPRGPHLDAETEQPPAGDGR